MGSVIENAQIIVKPIIENLGYEIVEIEYKKMYGENNLTIYIFKKGGISLEDCESVTNALDKVLEDNDISMGQAYNLNISSPGLDRLIVTEDDFRRNLDEEIELLFIIPIVKKKQAHGFLVAYDDKNITIKEKDKNIKYDRANINCVRPYINFK